MEITTGATITVPDSWVVHEEPTDSRTQPYVTVEFVEGLFNEGFLVTIHADFDSMNVPEYMDVDRLETKREFQYPDETGAWFKTKQLVEDFRAVGEEVVLVF